VASGTRGGPRGRQGGGPRGTTRTQCICAMGTFEIGAAPVSVQREPYGRPSWGRDRIVLRDREATPPKVTREELEKGDVWVDPLPESRNTPIENKKGAAGGGGPFWK